MEVRSWAPLPEPRLRIWHEVLALGLPAATEQILITVAPYFT